MRPTPQANRTRRPKGHWMRLRDADLLRRYMETQDFTQARLARYAECSRQFIHMLLSGERRTCKPQVGRRIEEALRVLPGTLFTEVKSPTSQPLVANEMTRATVSTRRRAS